MHDYEFSAVKLGNVTDINLSNTDGTYYLLFSTSSADSGSSLFLVSGSRELSAPATSVKLPKTAGGMDQWNTTNMLSSGDITPPALADMPPKAVAVCLKEGWEL